MKAQTLLFKVFLLGLLSIATFSSGTYFPPGSLGAKPSNAKRLKFLCSIKPKHKKCKALKTLKETKSKDESKKKADIENVSKETKS